MERATGRASVRADDLPCIIEVTLEDPNDVPGGKTHAATCSRRLSLCMDAEGAELGHDEISGELVAEVGEGDDSFLIVGVAVRLHLEDATPVSGLRPDRR